MGSTAASSEIPIVDFAKFLNGSGEEKEEVARQLDSAFCNVGFVYLKNHGVLKELVEECFSWNKKFFALPQETKMLAPHPPGGSHHRGYSGPGAEKVTQHIYDKDEISKQNDDFKESFESGNIHDTDQPNIWPPDDTLPGFRPFMETFFLSCSALVHNVLDALSLALHTPSPNLLSSAHGKSRFQLRILHYPPVAADQLKDSKRSRINAHSDFGSLTLLFQDSVGGLEVEDPHQPGIFRPAPPIEGTVLVNIGDLMARWSNDRWRSTVHRVGLPERAGLGEMVPDRYSIPFFATPDRDTIVEALPGCWDDGSRPRRYGPVTTFEYVQMRMETLYN
ncbi:Clavaminate synthase-like protein [Massarina eburnea CBS 473.64]|uniref:Clavaminate synthase-like protein n=1 Tax=Massarina eburnea CBS 473.64 TaxID=1395130 RepID=A0A6A6S133_9PLEO|nr:Clavaminate synthase-like protein [Massarina eburnea CBS 473.64]